VLCQTLHDLDMLAARLAAAAAHDAAERAAAGKGRASADGVQVGDVKRRIADLALPGHRTRHEHRAVPGDGCGNRPAS
jgi:hypothetical protein